MRFEDFSIQSEPSREACLQGPLTRPLTIVPIVVTNVVWGAVCGACALCGRRVRG